MIRLFIFLGVFMTNTSFCCSHDENSNGKKEIKVAFITGANRGLGFETARSLGKNGIYVILGSRNEIQGMEAAKKLQEDGISCCSFLFDVNQTSDHEKVYAYIEKNLESLIYS